MVKGPFDEPPGAVFVHAHEPAAVFEDPAVDQDGVDVTPAGLEDDVARPFHRLPSRANTVPVRGAHGQVSAS